MALRRARPEGVREIFGKNPARALALLRAAWPKVVGPELARRTELVAIEGKTLRVKVPDARWRKVLHRMERDLLSSLYRIAGDLTPRRLGFVEGPVGDGDAPPPPLVPGESATALPAPDASPALVQAAEAIADQDLRGQFLATAARYLARDAGRKGL